MEIKAQAHTVYYSKYHVVWIPKYRRKILVTGVKHYLARILPSVLAKRYPDVYIDEQNIQPDHLHLVIDMPPKYSMSHDIIKPLKSRSARLLKKRFEFLSKYRSVWSVGYFVSTIGINEQIVKKYIVKRQFLDTNFRF